MAEEKKRGTFWFMADAATFNAVFRAELERRLKIMEEELKSKGSLVKKCPMWSYVSLCIAMLYLIVLTIWTWFSPNMVISLASFFGPLIILAIIIALEYTVGRR
jgi:phosphoglycerol transferase MdoB-like AlkP superfamily enzyme